METTCTCTKLFLAIIMVALTFACSSQEDSTPPPKPVPDPEPVAPTPLQISNGVVTGVDAGYSDIVFPSSVKRIGKKAFANNKEIRKLTLNEGLEAIEENAFFSSGITEINFPASLKEMKAYAFYSCKNLTKADLSKTKLTTLPKGAFGQSEVQFASLPTTLTEIGIQAFSGTSKLTGIEIPVKTERIGNEAFRASGIISALLPNNLSHIDQRAFYFCPNLKEVKTYGEVKKANPESAIESSCFEGCLELTTFAIPQNICHIGQGILNRNTKIESITLPANVNSIAFSAFNNTNIKHAIIEASTPPTARLTDAGAWYGFAYNIVNIKVPTGKAALYQTTIGWREFAKKISE